MKTLLDKNPWKVESIQDFSCLKCPECIFFTKEQNYFEDHAISNHPLSATLFDESMSSYEIDDSVNEEVLDTVDHVNVSDIKKEPTDQDTSEDPFDICDSNIKQEDDPFISSSPNKCVLSDNESSLNPENKPKKLKMERRKDVRISIKKVKKHSDLLELPIPFILEPKIRQRKQNISERNQVDVVDSVKEAKEQRDILLESQIPFIPEKKPKKRQRMPKIAEITNDQWKGGHFMGALIGYNSSIDKFSSKPANQLKKVNKEPKDFDKPDNRQILDLGSTLIQHEFPCSFCNYTTKIETDFKTHLESVHAKESDTIYNCLLCDFKDSNYTKFNNHQRTHKQYQCTGCGNHFHGANSKSLFKMHLDTVQSRVIYS